MFDEETLEKVTMEMLQNLEYECINGYEMERQDFSKILLDEDLRNVIEKINRGIKDEQVIEAIRLVKNLDSNNTVLNNKQFTKYLLEGVPVPVQENGETRYITVKILDLDNINNNEQAGDKETRAKQVALNKFRSMGEISITENDLNVITVMRKGLEHYYIETRLNNLEIEASTGKITKVNNNPVE